jgi:hypothetical protein
LVGIADPEVFAEARKQGKFLPYSPHNGDFRVDLKAIPIGTKVATLAVLDLLAKNPAN